MFHILTAFLYPFYKNLLVSDYFISPSIFKQEDCKEIQPVHSKGGQSWVFFRRTDAKAETPILWPPHAKNWLIGKDPDAGRDWGQEEKGTTEDEMARWHHRLDGHEIGWTLAVGDGQVPGASVRNPARDKVMRKEADIRKACSDFRGPSGNS